MSLDLGVIGAAFLYVLTSGLRTGAPLILATIGGGFSAQVRIFNISLEGTMLAGAFAGFAASDLTGSAVLGLCAGVITGAAISLILAVACIDMHADEIVIGSAINLAVLGLTAVLLGAFYNSEGSYMSMQAGLVRPFDAEWLAGIPILRTIVESLDWVIVAALALVIAMHWFSYHTSWGLRIRAIGDNPDAVATAGVSVRRYRYLALLIGGALSGLAGAYLPLAGLSLFGVGMTAGMGFIALAAITFSNGRPLLGAAVAFLFGLATALGIQLERLHVPSEAIQALPYVLTIGALFIHATRVARRAA